MPSSVRAQTTATSAIEPFVIQVFSPLSTQSAPSRTARVRMPGRIRSEIGLGQTETADRFARLQARQPALFLLVRSVLRGSGYMTSAPCTETKLRRPESPRSSLLHDEPVLDIAHAGAAVAFEIGAEKAELRHFGDEFGRERGVAEMLADDGQDALVDEPAGGLPDQKFLFGELRIDKQVIDAAEGHVFQSTLSFIEPSRKTA